MMRFQVQLTEEQVRALDLRAAKRGTSRAALVREAVDAYVLKTPALDQAELMRRSLRAIGRGASGFSDVAERHDFYLAQAANDDYERTAREFDETESKRDD